MPVQITIIGLGQLGASIGLALAAHKEKILRVGHDVKPEAGREAQKKGAVDKSIHNLPDAVREAKIIVLAIPASGVRKTLEWIAPDLQEGSVVLDASPVKAAGAAWARELLPENRHYVGIAPSINPDLLHDFSFGLDSARADFFQNGVCLVGAADSTPEQAVTLAADFARLLGCTPVFSDVYEADGLTTTTHILPQMISAALLNATVDKPGWQEARKVTNRPYAALTSGMDFESASSLLLSAAQNRASLLHGLDVTIAALRGLREDLEKEDEEALRARLQSAVEARSRWLNERRAANWEQASLPKTEYDQRGFLDRLLGPALTKPFKKK